MKFNECSMSQEGILSNLQKGLNSEVRAYDLCRELLDYIEDENDKKVIEKIMQDEKEHIKITEELISVTKAFYNK
jgi:rubrerythrin